MSRHRILNDAVWDNDVEEVKRLIPLKSISDIDFAMCWAAKNGRADCLKILIEHTNPRNDDSLALIWAAEGEHKDCIEILIPVSDPTANNSEALHTVVEDQNIDLMNILIPVSDVTAKNSEALAQAAILKNKKIFDILYPLSEAHQAPLAIEALSLTPQQTQINLQKFYQLQAQYERDIMNNNIEHKAVSNTRPKKI